MDEIIQILVFAGAMIASVVIQSAKNKKKPKTVTPQEVLEDMFPDLQEFQEEVSAEAEPVRPVVVPPKRKPFKVKAKPEPPRPAVSAPDSPKSDKIRLNSRKEAKRAFIYSEIFNRKY